MPDASDGDLLGRLQQNINSVTANPTVPLETRAYEEAELVLPKQLQNEQQITLIQSLMVLLPSLQQDPSPAVNLLVRLLENFGYNDILNLGGNSLRWTDGLAVGEHMTSYNRLMLNLLEKATTKPSDAAHVATMLDTMLALVKLWLCTSDTGIASQASKLLLDLLRVDQAIRTDPDAPVPPNGGQGLVWRRIFGDRNVYGTIFEAASLSGPSSLTLSKNQRTLAQARLMEWLPTVGAMDWNAISRNHHEDVEQAYGVKEGLLEFAALRMVDYKDDVLMHRCLVDFYSDLLHTTKASATAIAPKDSPSLRYLITQGLHARTATIYLQLPGTPVDAVESMFLYGPAANYIATYASGYAQHFLTSQMPKQINERLTRALDLSPAKWAHAESPKHDLHLIASLPRKSLLPAGDGTGSWSSSPVSLLPSRSTNPDVLNTLAAVFHGPEKQIITFPPGATLTTDDEEASVEAATARALYYTYLANNPRFWLDITTHADTVVLKDLALSAINCLLSLIAANWSTTPELALPTSIATPDHGHIAIMTPPALEYALPYLLSPPRTFANLVGGRGDAESTAYKIASAKFDAVKALHSKVATQVERQPGEGYEEILATLGKRLAEGPLSREGEVGGRIGTLDL